MTDQTKTKTDTLIPTSKWKGTSSKPNSPLQAAGQQEHLWPASLDHTVRNRIDADGCSLQPAGLKGIMIGAAPGTADTPRAHITNMAALGELDSRFVMDMS